MAATRSDPPPLPVTVARISRGGSVRPVWQNALGGTTYELTDGASRSFLKWAPAESPIDLSEERHRLEWAVRYASVPMVLDHGAELDGSWLLTRGLPGESAVSSRWLSDPQAAVRAIGAGLRALHDALPATECPFSWSLMDRRSDIHRRARAGLLDPDTWHADHRALTIDQALARLQRSPPEDDLVVCHGDTCAPNTIIGSHGQCTGHVDLGSLGVADRWADIAIATWSTTWNYGHGWESTLLDAYGMDPEPSRIAYYRLLYDLGP